MVSPGAAASTASRSEQSEGSHPVGGGSSARVTAKVAAAAFGAATSATQSATATPAQTLMRLAFDGVVEEVDQDLPQAVRIGDDLAGAVRPRELDRDVLALDEGGPHLFDDVAGESGDVDLSLVEAETAGGERVGEQDVSRDACQS